MHPRHPHPGDDRETLQSAGRGMPVHRGTSPVEQDRTVDTVTDRPVDRTTHRRRMGTILPPLPHTRSTRWLCSSPRSSMIDPHAPKIRRPSSPSIATSAMSNWQVEVWAAVMIASNNDQLLRQTNGKPISRRYNYLWERLLGRHLSWVRAQGLSIYWLRVTTFTWVERNFGYGVARGSAPEANRTGEYDQSVGTYGHGGDDMTLSSTRPEPDPEEEESRTRGEDAFAPARRAGSHPTSDDAEDVTEARGETSWTMADQPDQPTEPDTDLLTHVRGENTWDNVFEPHGVLGNPATVLGVLAQRQDARRHRTPAAYR